MAAETHILLNPDGTVSIEVFGVKGSGCVELSKPYCELFEIQKETKTNEFYQQETATGRQQQRH